MIATFLILRCSYAGKLLNDNGFQNPRNGQNDDKAHPPITPCKAVDPETIGDPTQRSVYKLIAKHYLACCSRDAVGRETSITARMGQEEFTAKGLMILEKNWLEIYAPWERWSTGQGELPPLEVGSRITPASFLMKEGRTTPPQPLTEAELIALMDRNGIGTDATIAQHISTIQDRSYANKDGNQRFHPTPLGIALVEGYNSMGYQLNKPDLRREMEHECNLVANGQKTKEDIIGPLLDKMKSCFEAVNAEAHKLDEAIGRRFSRLGVNDQNSTLVQARFSECGGCHSKMAMKQSRAQNNAQTQNRKLLYCQTCQLGLGLPTRGNFQAMTNPEGGGGNPVKCPICQYQVIKVVAGNGYTGNGYTLCPHCFSNPPAAHGGAQGGGDFRCFQCQHPTCSLASGTPGGDVEAFPCTFCQTGKVMLKKNTRGFILSCNNYSSQQRCSYTIWLPKESSSVSIPDNTFCASCSRPQKQVRKANFVFRPGSVPPHIDREVTVCVLCDSAFRQDLNIRLPVRGQVATNPRRTPNTNNNDRHAVTPPNRNVWDNPPIRGNGGGRGGYGRGGRGGREGRGRGGRGGVGGGRGGRVGGRGANLDNITCYKCQQAGHFANRCPNA